MTSSSLNKRPSQNTATAWRSGAGLLQCRRVKILHLIMINGLLSASFSQNTRHHFSLSWDCWRAGVWKITKADYIAHLIPPHPRTSQNSDGLHCESQWAALSSWVTYSDPLRNKGSDTVSNASHNQSYPLLFLKWGRQLCRWRLPNTRRQDTERCR